MGHDAERCTVCGLSHLVRSVRRTSQVVAQSPAMQEVLKRAARFAKASASVVVLGESGSGKEVVARALHQSSTRSDKPFVAVNVAALPAELLESELFGHVRGAFTGAVADRRGRFEAADGGTIFLDEIGDMSLKTQAKVLRVLQEQVVEPVGSTQRVRVDVRVIAATNKDLPAAIKAGQFREDLYFRLNVIPIFVPPLRARQDDIPLLAEYFMAGFAQEYGRRPKAFEPAAVDLLRRYSWPGNVRELRNLIERLVIMVPGDNITAADLAFLGQGADAVAESPAQPAAPVLPLHEARDRFERDYILRALAQQRGNMSRTAEVLGVERSNLYRKMRAFGIAPGKRAEEEAVRADE